MRSLDGVDRPAYATPELHVQRSMARADLEHAPAAFDLETVEEGGCRRVPEPGLLPQAGRLPSGVAEEVAIGHQEIVRDRPAAAIWFLRSNRLDWANPACGLRLAARDLQAASSAIELMTRPSA